MNQQGVVVLLFTGTTFLTGLYVMWRYSAQRLQRLLAMQFFGTAAYGLFLFGLASATERASAATWVRYGNVLPYLVLFFFYWFAVVFSRAESLRWTRWLPLLAAIPAVEDIVGRFMGAFALVPMEFRPGQGWFPGAEWPYLYLYVPATLALLGSSLGLLLWRWRRTESALERQSLGIVFAAMGIGAGLCLTCFSHRYGVFMPLGPLVYVGIMAYGLTRRRLLDINLIVREGAVAALGGLFLTALVALVIMVALRALDIPMNLGSLFAAALLFALLYPVQRKWIRSVLGPWLGRDIDVRQSLLEYSLLAGRHPAFEDQMGATLERLLKEHGLSRALLYVANPNGSLKIFAARPRAGKFPSLDSKSDAVAALQASPEGLDLDTLGWTRMYERVPVPTPGEEAVRALLVGYGMQAGFPLLVRGRLKGLLLVGAPVSGRALLSLELDFFAALAAQMGGMVENNALEGQVQHADRLSTLGLLAASVAHEIRNPLTSIGVFVSMLPTSIGDPEFVKKFNRVFNAEMQKLSQLCDDMTSLSRPATLTQVGQLQIVDLGQLCERERVLVAMPYRKREVALRMQCPEGVMVRGEESRLGQVLLNLLLNALDASDQGDEVVVEVVKLSSHAELRVRDYGQGISAENMALLFQPFFTTKAEGHGLGLATSWRICESLGGSLEAANPAGGGAEFIARLPLALEHTKEAKV